MHDRNTKSLIAVSIISADFTDLRGQIKQVEQAGVDWIHVDVMDGHFVPNLTMGPFMVKTIRKLTNLPLDVHLMMEKPEAMLADFARAGADSLTVHFETCPHLHRTLQQIHDLGCRAGVVLNPGTPAGLVLPVLHLVDLVLVMSVNPGFSGQTFLPEVLSKASEIRQALDQVNPEALVQMDGGITSENAGLIKQAGVQVFVSATSIFTHPQGIHGGVQALRQALA